MSMTAAPRGTGWLTTMIERARTRGVDDQEIAAALESTIDIRPLNLERDRRNRLVPVIATCELTVNDLLDSLDEK
jgi:hypothetical protein